MWPEINKLLVPGLELGFLKKSGVRVKSPFQSFFSKLRNFRVLFYASVLFPWKISIFPSMNAGLFLSRAKYNSFIIFNAIAIISFQFQFANPITFFLLIYFLFFITCVTLFYYVFVSKQSIVCFCSLSFIFDCVYLLSSAVFCCSLILIFDLFSLISSCV